MAESLRRTAYCAIRHALLLLDRLAGRFSPRIRSICRYLAGLLEDGRHAEFAALMRHGVSKALGRTRPEGGLRQRQRPKRPIAIDARHQILAPDGRVRAKPGLDCGSRDPLLVSIIIPCFNYGRYLREAVDSALVQTVASREVIVVDDGSDDPLTAQVVRAVAALPGVRVLRQQNQGLPLARNAGIAVARGEYVCCLDADDVILPTYLECAIALMEADRSIGFAYSWAEFFGDVSETWKTRDFDPEAALLGNFTAVSAVFRRDDWRIAGGFSAAMRGGFEDWEFWIRLAALGRRGVAIRRPLFRHRRHGRTMTHDAKAMAEDLRLRMRTLNPAFFADRRLRCRLSSLVGGSTETPDRKPFRRLQPVRPGGSTRPGLLVVVRWLKLGGAEVLLHTVLQALHRDWRITLLTTDEDGHVMAGQFAAVTPEIYHLAEWLEPQLRLPFVMHCIETRSTGAILTSGSAWFLDALPRLRTGDAPLPKVVSLLHNDVPAGPLRAALTRDADIMAHVTVSGSTTRALQDAGLDPDRIHEIPNGIDTALFNFGRVDQHSAREALGIRRGGLCLLWIGRLSEEKRPLAFVEITRQVARRRPVQALMIGDGPLHPAVRRSADEGLPLRMMPSLPREHLPALYAAADFLVLTSAVEGMPLVVLESLAMGCPVAATAVGDIERIVAVGRNGLLVPRDRPEAIAQELLSDRASALMTPDRRKAIATGFVASPHTQDRMVSAYRSLLAQVTHA